MVQVITEKPPASTKSSWKLGGLNPWQLGRTVFEQIIADNVFGRAAELAFYFLFALFPLIFLMMTSVGLVVSHDGELQYDLLSYFADLFPPPVFGLLKISFLNTAHHLRETRPWFKARAIALGLSLLISTLLIAALFMVLVGTHFVGWLGAVLDLNPLLVLVWKALQWPIAIFFVALSCSLIYYYGPDLKEHRRWHWFTPGAAVGGLYGWWPRLDSVCTFISLIVTAFRMGHWAP